MGECQDGSFEYTCTCHAGFEGLNCADDNDECDSTPCKNDAVCAQVSVDAYRCTCIDGWVGENCEEDSDGFPRSVHAQRDPCESVPCMHGQCVQNPVGQGDPYTCKCEKEWDGENCEEVKVLTFHYEAEMPGGFLDDAQKIENVINDLKSASNLDLNAAAGEVVHDVVIYAHYGQAKCQRPDQPEAEDWHQPKADCANSAGTCTNPASATTKETCTAGVFISTAAFTGLYMGDNVKFQLDVFDFNKIVECTSKIVSGAGTPDGWKFIRTNFGACNNLQLVKPPTAPAGPTDIISCIKTNGYPLPLRMADQSAVALDLYMLQDLTESYIPRLTQMKGLVGGDTGLHAALDAMFTDPHVGALC